jgi:dihydrofolate synthase/folylpolyglutamate synthase
MVFTLACVRCRGVGVVRLETCGRRCAHTQTADDPVSFHEYEFKVAIMRFPSYSRFMTYLDSLGLFSMRPGLERMRQALNRMDLTRMDLTRPQGAVVHVVGTNGKGSTSGFLAALGQAHGLRVGLYTSPHLVSVRERIRIDGRPLSEERWVDAANAVMERCADVGLTYFELITIMTLHIFRSEAPDLIVLEAGLGGTHDATCVVPFDLAVMTPVGMDHEHVFGPTILDVAKDKSGALGRCPAVIGMQDGRVRRMFEQTCAGRPFWNLEDLQVPAGFAFPGGTILSGEALPDHPPYQVENAALALLAWSRLAEMRGWISDSALCTLTLARTRFPGRFYRHGRFLVDGAHNAMGLTALCEALVQKGEHFDRLVFQSMRDKVLPDALLSRLGALADEILIPALPELERAGDPTELARRFGFDAGVADSPAEALAPEGTVLVCGSLYLAGAYYALHPEQLGW